jgi:hypothetical protein
MGFLAFAAKQTHAAPLAQARLGCFEAAQHKNKAIP